MKVSGELPLLSLDMSDKRLQELLSLVDSIPLPESTPAVEVEEEMFVVNLNKQYSNSQFIQH